MFHVSQLELAVLNPFHGHNQPPPPPIVVNGEQEFEVSEILDSKINQRFKADNELCYFVKWTGYKGTDEETSWIPAQDLSHAPDLILSFHQQFPNRPKPGHQIKLSAYSTIVANLFFHLFHFSMYFSFSLFSPLLLMLHYCQF